MMTHSMSMPNSCNQSSPTGVINRALHNAHVPLREQRSTYIKALRVPTEKRSHADKAALMDLAQKIRFRDKAVLETIDRNALCQVMRLQATVLDEVIIEQGAVGDAVYIVLSGAVTVYVAHDPEGEAIAQSASTPAQQPLSLLSRLQRVRMRERGEQSCQAPDKDAAQMPTKASSGAMLAGNEGHLACSTGTNLQVPNGPSSHASSPLQLNNVQHLQACAAADEPTTTRRTSVCTSMHDRQQTFHRFDSSVSASRRHSLRNEGRFQLKSTIEAAMNCSSQHVEMTTTSPSRGCSIRPPSECPSLMPDSWSRPWLSAHARRPSVLASRRGSLAPGGASAPSRRGSMFAKKEAAAEFENEKPTKFDDNFDDDSADDNIKRLWTFTAFDCFGDLALIFNKPRTASVVAERDTMLIRVERNDYDRYIKAAALEAFEAALKIHPFLPSRFQIEALRQEVAGEKI